MDLKSVLKLLLLLTFPVFGVVALVSLCGCGGEDIEVGMVQSAPGLPPSTVPYCGDGICDFSIGESYWTCLDCVDPLTGAPTNSYCGDGVCFNESMIDCWKDCKPQRQDTASGFLPNRERLEIDLSKINGPRVKHDYEKLPIENEIECMTKQKRL